MFENLSLKYRIALVIFCLEVIMMTAVVTTMLEESFQSSSDYQKANEQMLLNLVSDLSSSALLIEEFSELQSYFEQLTNQPDLVRLRLVDLNNVIVASSNLQSIGQQAQPLRTTPPNYTRSIIVACRKIGQTHHGVYQ